MKVDSTEYPLLVSNDNYGDYLKSSENILELCFENVQSPAVYVAAGGMLSSFSTGTSNFYIYA
jgi:actin-related protein